MAVSNHLSFLKLFFTSNKTPSNKTPRLTIFLTIDHILSQGPKERRAFILPMEEIKERRARHFLLSSRKYVNGNLVRFSHYVTHC